MIDRDRFSDEYDPEPDYDRPTRAEALEEQLADERWASTFAERKEAQALAAERYVLGLRAHLNHVHGVATADIDDIALDTVHNEAHGREQS